MSGRIYAASLVALSLTIAAAISWPVFSILAALYLLVLVAWALVERAEAWAVAREAQAAATRAVDQAETFADELKAVCAANEVLCAELAASDQQRIVSDGIIARLRGDVLDAQMRLADALNGAEHAPLADVVPIEGLRVVPEQRDGAHDDLPVADGYFPVHTEIEDDDLTALMRATEEK